MHTALKNTCALVTGASRGVGRAIAIALASNGALVVASARSAEGLARTVELIEESGGRGVPISADLADDSAIVDLIARARDRLGRLDILVNNAGVTHSAQLAETTTAAWDRCMAINARAPFVLCREALPLLRRGDAARIINIASVVAVKGYARQSAYTASKHALRGMSIALAEELRESNIRVHVLCPGGIRTDMVTQVRPDIPAADLIDPEEIAQLVVYLAGYRGNAVIDDLHIRRAASAPWY